MRRILLGLILAAVLAACGSKGPLYHPEDKPPPKKPAAQTPASAPAPKVQQQ